jgi:hypothetical protein
MVLPAAATHFVTVNPVTGKGRNPPWRRYGTDRPVRVLLRVAEAYAAAHPDAPRPVVGDLNRPHGGRFVRAGPGTCSSAPGPGCTARPRWS